MYWFLDEMSWKKKSSENLQYNLDNWDGLAHLTRRYTCKLVIQRKYSKELQCSRNELCLGKYSYVLDS